MRAAIFSTSIGGEYLWMISIVVVIKHKILDESGFLKRSNEHFRFTNKWHLSVISKAENKGAVHRPQVGS